MSVLVFNWDFATWLCLVLYLSIGVSLAGSFLHFCLYDVSEDNDLTRRQVLIGCMVLFLFWPPVVTYLILTERV